VDRLDSKPEVESPQEVDALGDDGGVVASASCAMEMVVVQWPP